MKKQTLLLMFIVIFSFGSKTAFTQNEPWMPMFPMPTVRALMAGSVVDGKIYVIGGISTLNRVMGTVEVYDPATDSWEKKKDMTYSRAALAIQNVDGIIYAIGGATSAGGNSISIVEAYDPSSDSWTRKADMLNNRMAFSAVLDGRIYIIGGGTNGSSMSTKTEAYDPKTNTWTVKKDMPESGGNIALVVKDSLIYSFGGGYSNVPAISTVLVYNPRTDTWTKKTDMPTPRMGAIACLVNGKIYVLGGTSSGGGPGLANVEVYDPEKDTWTKEGDMPIAKKYPVGAVVNEKIYVIGGVTGSTYLNSVEEYNPALDPTSLGGSNDVNPPSEYSLYQNYPNPFNPVTNIEFKVVDPGMVTLKVFDLLGNEVVTIINKDIEPGFYKYQWNACGNASGIYLYRIKAGNYIETRKMILLK